MPHREDGMLVLQHEALESPFEVCSVWLRDHCRCANCYGDTYQRKCNINEISLNVEPTALKAEHDFLHVTCEF